MPAIEDGNGAVERVARARRLFEFLARAQELKAPRVRDVQSYEHVLWLGELPSHTAVNFDVSTDAPSDRPVLVLRRVTRSDPPPSPPQLEPWLESRGVRADQPPRLADSIARPPSGDGSVGAEVRELLSEHPEVRRSFDDWLPIWSEWAERDRVDQTLQAAYRDLFNSYELSSSKPDEYELVVGVGCLAWRSSSAVAVRRHLLTSPARLDLDESTGDLVATVDSGVGFQFETDMFDPGQIPPALDIEGFTRDAAADGSHPLDAEAVGRLARRLTLSLGPESSYGGALERPSIQSRPVGVFAPALILRRRSTRGLVQLLREIGRQLESAADVPAGLRPLVDPDFVREVDWDPQPGGLVAVDDEVFQAMPVNARQQQVIVNVDSYAQTLVQGPPGTGKTHTAAALLTHLLAQGKRVLITAQTDRALKEVRGKLPAAIRPLAVSVLGASRADTADLKTAVETIASQAGEFDRAQADRDVDERLATIDALRRERATVYRRLRDTRERETTEFAHLGYQGTLATIAQRIQHQESIHGWLREFGAPAAGTVCPLDADQATEWLTLLRDPDLQRDASAAAQELPSLSSLPTPEDLADQIERLVAAESAVQGHASDKGHPAYRALQGARAEVRRAIQQQMRQLGRWSSDLERHHEDWTNGALADIRAGRRSAWEKRAGVIEDLCREAQPLVEELGHRPNVLVKAVDVAVLRHQASELRTLLESGHVVKRGADGTPKVGIFAPRQVKAANVLFASVTVDGLPPTTSDQVTRFLVWQRAQELLDALDQAWPTTVTIPAEDTLHERLDWHVAELEQLRTLLALGDAIGTANRALAEAGLPQPDWSDLRDIEAYAAAVDAVTAAELLAAAREPVAELVSSMQRFADSRAAAHVVTEICAALRARDVAAYRRHRDRLGRLHEAKVQLGRRRDLGRALRRSAPNLVGTIESQVGDPVWTERVAQLPAAWRWAATAMWILEQEVVDANELQQRLNRIETRIRQEIERLAATRAWRHAVSPSRLTGTARADLTQYAQLVRRLGKGTGKYAAVQRAEIRNALDRCGSAVPVWIMPIYRIAEQLTVRENMFDVVVVDEASQAGMESAFLQYLAPKIVVIGDDKQVSPSAVGVNRQELRDLADQYLRDDRYKASWQDPERSLFDEAKMRYGSMITLVEHRRCVPEIIGFSNRIAYEPEGIRLLPVRQYGSDRLEPIVCVHLADGYETGSTSKVNRVEVDAIVSQIEKCLADPRYDGMTFGVISLLGTAQARRIEARLLERIPPEEWTARDLRCGDAADFQGSERDVVFLSMVAAPSDRRLPALTRDLYVQRYNVAASRAKDQLWLFHSLQIGDVVNGDDMRYQLLDYCYGVANRRHARSDDAIITAVSEDELVDPFDSLFEQRVFNRILDRGYRVQPQVSTDSYRLDLVIEGARARLAVECDGDHWHGPDRYASDLARQRDLERAGWTFFRIRESEFYLDTSGVLKRLWSALDDLDIHPHGQDPEPLAAVVSPEGEASTLAELEEDLSEVIAETGPTAAESGNDVALDDLAVPPVSPPIDDVQEPVTAHQEPAAGEPLPSYRMFWGEVPHPVDASSTDVMRALIEIVAVEGPVTRNRLFFAYVQASEVQRAGKIIVDHLGQALGKAVRSGHLLAEGRGASVSYRLAEQPAVRRRQLGPRLLADVPPAELAALLDDAASLHGWRDHELIFREVLSRIGLRRLTSDARNVLVKALAARARSVTEPT